MRLDHSAFRVADRKKTAQFFIDAFGYKIQQEFQIDFPDGSKAECIALEPPEKIHQNLPWKILAEADPTGSVGAEFHMAQEIFVSDGPPGSIVGDWVAKRGGIGGLHHQAFQVSNVRETMKLWIDKGWAEFTTADVLTCPEDELDQVFTKPNPLTGVIYEFIKRGDKGFCSTNVKDLMISTKGL